MENTYGPGITLSNKPYDYSSPGFKTIRLADYFPNLIAGDPKGCPWPHLRRDVPHTWYCDRRAPGLGVLNHDEAHILYNTALRLLGSDALEIGCSMGWSACHMAAGGVALDIVDPLLGADWVRRSIIESLTAAGVMGRVRLHAAPSPEALDALGSAGKRWSLMLIDGNHDFPAPLLNAVACERWATTSAAIVMHHVNAPSVGEAVYFFRDRGWKTRIYQTAQIMAVAWRGAVEPVDHVPDPTAGLAIPDHLRAVS
jgi:hypothetical protein